MSLPDTPPKIIPNDAKQILAESVTLYEELTGKTLYPTQAEQFVLNVIAYRESVWRADVERGFWQNLIRFATGQMLDELGQLFRDVNGERLAGENNEQYRERLFLAPAAYSTAGSSDSYVYHTRTADVSIIDVGVSSPSPGVVNVYPLVAGGIPDQDLLNKVYQANNARKTRPLTDNVRVLAPEFEDYELSADIVLLPDAVEEVVRPEIEARLTAVQNELRLLGITDSEHTRLLKVDGVFDVQNLQPAGDIALAAGVAPRLLNWTLNFVGVANG